MRREPGPGVLAYVDGEVAGWCSVAPKSTYRALVNSQTIPHVQDEAAWSVVCFVVRPRFRRRGLMHQLLDGAAGHAQAMGATMLEGYPVDPGGQRINQTSGYGAPSSSLKHMDSGASARPPVGAAANPAGSCAASFPDQKKQYAQATTPRARLQTQEIFSDQELDELEGSDHATRLRLTAATARYPPVCASLTGVGCCRLVAQNEFSVAAVSRRECRRPTADPVVRIGRVEFAEDRG